MGGFVAKGLCQTAMDLNEKVKTGEYVQKVENFMVILDASDTMNTLYKEQSRWKIARDVLSLFNRTVPNISVVGAIRKYSDSGNYNDLTPTELVYGPTKYSQSGFEGGLNKIRRAEGNSPLDLAISAAIKDLEQPQGSIAVIIMTDGEAIPHGPVLKATENMKRQFGDRICIYTVGVGDDADGKELLNKVAQAGKCGCFTPASSISSEAGMADFVEKVFLARVEKPAVSPPPPSTPPPTPPPARQIISFHSGYFEFDKSDLTPEIKAEMDRAAKIMQDDPDVVLELQGNTDSIGTDAYNKALGYRRADAVFNYLKLSLIHI